MIRLLAIDMDGTCLNGRSRISPRTMAALEAAHNARILIVPTTGRPLTCLPHLLAARRDLYRYVITSNGARVTDLQTSQTLFQAEIPKDTALSLLKDLRSLHMGRTAHVNHDYLVQGQILHAMGRIIYGKDAKESPCVSDLTDVISRGACNVEELQFFFFRKDSANAVRQVLAPYPTLLSAYTGLYVEIYHRNASKGAALSALCQKLGIPKEQVACMGDGENDCSMFAASGLPLAMGNSAQSLQAMAKAVLPDNRHDGAAEGIFRYVLEQEPVHNP